MNKAIKTTLYLSIAIVVCGCSNNNDEFKPQKEVTYPSIGDCLKDLSPKQCGVEESVAKEITKQGMVNSNPQQNVVKQPCNTNSQSSTGVSTEDCNGVQYGNSSYIYRGVGGYYGGSSGLNSETSRGAWVTNGTTQDNDNRRVIEAGATSALDKYLQKPVTVTVPESTPTRYATSTRVLPRPVNTGKPLSTTSSSSVTRSGFGRTGGFRGGRGGG